MPRLASRILGMLLVTSIAAATVPAAAQADFEISAFDVGICPTDVAPTPPAGQLPCTGTSAPAGSHRASTVSFDFGGTDHVKDIIQHFPVGIIPNPENVAKCPAAVFSAPGHACPANSKLGTSNLTANAELIPGMPVPVTLTGNVYNLEVAPPYVGGLGFVTNAGPIPAAALAAPFTVGPVSRTFRSSPTRFPTANSTPTTRRLVPHDSDDGLTGISADIPDNVEGIPIKITHIDYTLAGTNQTLALTWASLTSASAPAA